VALTSGGAFYLPATWVLLRYLPCLLTPLHLPTHYCPHTGIALLFTLLPYTIHILPPYCPSFLTSHVACLLRLFLLWEDVYLGSAMHSTMPASPCHYWLLVGGPYAFCSHCSLYLLLTQEGRRREEFFPFICR